MGRQRYLSRMRIVQGALPKHINVPRLQRKLGFQFLESRIALEGFEMPFGQEMQGARFAQRRIRSVQPPRHAKQIVRGHHRTSARSHVVREHVPKVALPFDVQKCRGFVQNDPM